MEMCMKKLKTLFALPMVLLITLLSGCVQIDVDTGIDQDFTAYLSYKIVLDDDDSGLSHQEELKDALGQISRHYEQKLGFTVSLQTDSAPFSLTLTRQVENDSFEQAFESLKSMLTDEAMTLFMQVDMTSESFFRQNRYILSATTDLPQIMRLSNAEALSPIVQQQLEEGMKSGEGAITLTLPASELVSSTHQASIEDNLAVMIVPLEYTDKASFEIAAKLYFLGNGDFGGSLESIVQENTKFRTISFIVFFAALVLLVIVLLIFVKRTRKQ